MAAAVDTQSEKAPRAIETFLKARLGEVQARFKVVEDKVKTQVAEVQKTLKDGPKATLDRVRLALPVAKLKDFLARPEFAKAQKAVADGVKLTTDTVEKLGLARIADIDAVKQGLETLGKKLDELKSHVEGLVKKGGAAVGNQDKTA